MKATRSSEQADQDIYDTQTAAPADARDPAAQNQKVLNQNVSSMRPVWIILFAAILVLICTKSKADDPPPQNATASHATMTIELNGQTHVIKPAQHPSSVQLATHSHIAHASEHVAHSNEQDGSRDRQASWKMATHSRPAYAQLSGSLANFDADADPDGWLVEVVLRDRRDRVVVTRAQARFELTPRLPVGDFQYFAFANATPITWSPDVSFDEDGVARLKLPLRQPLRHQTAWSNGWDMATYPTAGLGLRSVIYTQHDRLGRSGLRRRAGQPRLLGTTVTSGIRIVPQQPEFADLRVKLSVASEGVFEAVTVVPIRPSVLVDTHWPYR